MENKTDQLVTNILNLTIDTFEELFKVAGAPKGYKIPVQDAVVVSKQYIGHLRELITKMIIEYEGEKNESTTT